MIGRRAAIAALGGSLAALARGVRAQRPKVAHIGMLFLAPLASKEPIALRDAFLQGLRVEGFVEGQNLRIDPLGADGNMERLPELARRLAGLKPDLLVTGATPLAWALRNATNIIPIVAATMGDPVGDGLAASLARPGGNVTGLTFLGPELISKRFEFLTQAVPGLRRVAVLWHPGAYSEATTNGMRSDAEAAARALGLQLAFLAASQPEAIPRELEAARRGADALFVFPGALLFGEQRRIGAWVLQHRLPAIGIDRGFVEGGGLLAYGANIVDLYRRAANHAVRILKGARPADLPIEQPTKFDLTFNPATARALGIVLPPAMLVLAEVV